MTLIINIGLMLVVLGLFVLLGIATNERQKQIQLFGGDSSYLKIKNRFRSTKYIAQFRDHLKLFLHEKRKDDYFISFQYGILFVNLILFVYMIVIHQYFLSLLLPISLDYMLNKIFVTSVIESNNKLNEQLPFTINTIIKVFSRYSDIKTVIYETSREIDDPLKSQFEELYRKMLSEPQEKCITEWADRVDNLWIHTMVFILLSYQENATKADVINNLGKLRNIIERENHLKNIDVTDKHSNVVLNNVILMIAVLAGLANLIFNPQGKAFFFGSMFGVLCFVGGYALIALTVIINIKLQSKRERRN